MAADRRPSVIGQSQRRGAEPASSDGDISRCPRTDVVVSSQKAGRKNSEGKKTGQLGFFRRAAPVPLYSPEKTGAPPDRHFHRSRDPRPKPPHPPSYHDGASIKALPRAEIHGSAVLEGLRLADITGKEEREGKAIRVVHQGVGLEGRMHVGPITGDMFTR